MRTAILAAMVLSAAAVGASPALANAATTHGDTVRPASCAQPPDGLWTINYVTSLSNYNRATNVYSDWVGSRGNVSVGKTTTVTVNANLSAEVKANFGFWKLKLAEAKGHASVSSSYKRTTTWRYTLYVNPKAGYKGRVMLFHTTKRFTAVRNTWSPSKCAYVRVFATHNSAPLKGSNGNLWGVQYVRK